jgi:hypothetical protein
MRIRSACTIADALAVRALPSRNAISPNSSPGSRTMSVISAHDQLGRSHFAMGLAFIYLYLYKPGANLESLIVD